VNKSDELFPAGFHRARLPERSGSARNFTLESNPRSRNSTSSSVTPTTSCGPPCPGFHWTVARKWWPSCTISAVNFAPLARVIGTDSAGLALVAVGRRGEPACDHAPSARGHLGSGRRRASPARWLHRSAFRNASKRRCAPGRRRGCCQLPLGRVAARLRVDRLCVGPRSRWQDSTPNRSRRRGTARRGSGRG